MTWSIALYAVLSLTVVRMLPVADRDARHRRAPADGRLPRLVRAARARLDRLRRDPRRGGRPAARETSSSTTIVITIGLSILAHGLTAAPARRPLRRLVRVAPEDDLPDARESQRDARALAQSRTRHRAPTAHPDGRPQRRPSCVNTARNRDHRALSGASASMEPCRSSSSRLAPARRRARFLKVASAGAAVAGFGILSVLVRGAHTGSGGGAATSATGALDVSSRIAQEAEQIGLVLPVRLGRAVAGRRPTAGVDPDVVSTTAFAPWAARSSSAARRRDESSGDRATLRRSRVLAQPVPSGFRPGTAQPLAGRGGDRLAHPRDGTRGRPPGRSGDRRRFDPTIAEALEAAGYDRTFSERRLRARSRPVSRRTLARDPARRHARATARRAPTRPERRRQGTSRRRRPRAHRGRRVRLGGRRSRDPRRARRRAPGGRYRHPRVGRARDERRHDAVVGRARTATRQHHLIDPATGAPADVRGNASRFAQRHASRPTSRRRPRSSSGDDGPTGSSGEGCRADFVSDDEHRPRRRLARDREVAQCI